MREFIVRVNGEEFQVEVEEVRNGNRPAPTTPRTNRNVSVGANVKKPQPKANVNESNVVAPMPGTVLKVNVSEGDTVSAGDTIVVLEAMKLENNLSAPVSGTVKAIKANVGDSVNSGDILVEIE